MRQMIRTFVGHYVRYMAKNEKGVTAIEYGLIAALIAIAMITVLGPAGIALHDIFEKVMVELQLAAASVSPPS